MNKFMNGGNQVCKYKQLKTKKEMKTDLKSLLMAASEKVNEVGNQQTVFDTIQEFEQEVIDNMTNSICESELKKQYSLSDCLTNVQSKDVIVTIDGMFHSTNMADARIIQAVWNNNLYQISDILSERLDFEVTVCPDETEDAIEYKEILQSLYDENETEVLSVISLLITKFATIDEHSDNTYIVECSKYEDCIKYALDYLKFNDKFFEADGQHIDIVATTEDKDVFVVLIKKNNMKKVNSIEEIKQVFNNANLTEVMIRIGMFESIKLYAAEALVNNFPESFESNYIIDGKKQVIHLECDADNVIYFKIPYSFKLENINLLLHNYATIKQMDEKTYLVECSAFGDTIEYILQFLKKSETYISDINGTIDVIAVVVAPDVNIIETERTASYIIITK